MADDAGDVVGAVDCPLLGAVAAVDAPPAAVGDPAELTMAAPPVDPRRRARPRDSHLRGDMTDRALLTTLHRTQSAFERQRGMTVGHEGQVLSLARSAPVTAHFPPCATPATRAVP